MRALRKSRRPKVQPALHICGGCGQPFVIPVSVLDLLPDGRCVIELACTNCGQASVGSHGEAELEALDRALDATIEALEADAAAFELQSELERVDRFTAALRDDLILPEDF